MVIDLEEVGSAAGGSREFSGQVCVVGAGIAGLVLAERLAARGVRVMLLEAGGMEPEERSQRLYAAEMAGERHAGTTEGRFRVFGGSSTRWGGQLLPYTEDVFRPGAGVPSAGWAIGPEDVEPYYADVLRVMGVDGLPWEGGELLRALGREGVELSGDVRVRYSKWAPFARRNLARSVGAECLGSERVTVVLHANAVELEMRGGVVEAVRARSYAGGEFRFRAEEFAVCLGTIESARLLLASGLAERNDAVGRYFHDHVGVRAAELEGEARARVMERLGPFFAEGTLHTFKMEASRALREREGMAAAMAHVTIEEPEDGGAAAVRRMLQSVQRGRFGEAAGENLLPMLRGMGDVARLAWATRVRKRRAVSRRARVWLNLDMEQVAGPEDRVRLSEARDAVGMRRAVVDWRVGERARATARAFVPVVREELARMGVREGVRWSEWVSDRDGPEMLYDTFHPMGGLRMGEVVDRELRVCGVGNLSVASCAVFPGGGSSNPTFTMMALAMRLGERIAAG